MLYPPVGFQEQEREQEGVLYVSTELKHLERRLAVVSQIAQVTSAALGRDELMKAAYEAIAPFFEHETYTFSRYLRSEDSLRMLFSVSEEGESTGRQHLSLGGFSGIVVREDRPVYISDIEARSPSVSDPIKVEPGTAQGSWLGVPLRIRNQVIGVLSISTLKKKAYDDEDEHLLVTVADQVAVAFDNARLFEATRRQAERLSLLNRVSKAVSTTLDLNQLFEALYQEIAETFDHDEFFVVLHDKLANELNVVFGMMNGARLGQERLPFGGLSSLVIGERKTLNVRHFSAEKGNLTK